MNITITINNGVSKTFDSIEEAQKFLKPEAIKTQIKEWQKHLDYLISIRDFIPEHLDDCFLYINSLESVMLDEIKSLKSLIENPNE